MWIQGAERDLRPVFLNLNQFHPCIRIKRIVPDSQRIQIRVIALQVLQIDNPLLEEIGVGAADITGKMVHVCLRKPGQPFPRLKFLKQMEYGPEKFGETVMFKQVRVFQQTEHEIAPGNQKTFQTVHTAEPALHLHIAALEEMCKPLEIGICPIGQRS